MIDRYTRPGMGRIWTEENKYRMWLDVESAASDTLAEFGIVPAEAAKAIRDRSEDHNKRSPDLTNCRVPQVSLLRPGFSRSRTIRPFTIESYDPARLHCRMVP